MKILLVTSHSDAMKAWVALCERYAPRGSNGSSFNVYQATTSSGTRNFLSDPEEYPFDIIIWDHEIEVERFGEKVSTLEYITEAHQRLPLATMLACSHDPAQRESQMKAGCTENVPPFNAILDELPRIIREKNKP